MKRRLIVSAVAVLTLLGSLLGSTVVAAEDPLPPPILLSTQTYIWTDPVSQGVIHVTERVFEGDRDDPHHMRWSYEVHNVSYDPNPPFTNGMSGFQIIFPGPVPELHGQTSPAIGGPWVQNAFSGQFPPFGVEWDAPHPGTGIMPGQSGFFGFSTFERARVVVVSEGAGAGPAGWAHSWGLPEPIIDADGTKTGGPGLAIPNIQVRIGSALASWPTGGDVEGIDWFDNDWNGVSPRTWTPGDGIHVEGPAYAGAGAIRDALHTDTAPGIGDPHVVGVLPAGGAVSVDLEFNIDFGGGSGVDPRLKFHDANSATNWDDGEDIVLDTNLDGVFGTNTQVNIFHGVQSVPGPLLNMLGVAHAHDSSGGIMKKVKYDDADHDGRIEVGELVKFLVVVVVHNNSPGTWTNVVVQDRFGAELDVELAPQFGFQMTGTAALTTQGNSDKEFLTWNIGTLGPGDVAILTLAANTDLNPAGHQEYTTAGTYEFNSGAVLKYLVDGKKNSAETGSILVTVVEPD